jgi:hypothetical protein
MYRSFGSSGPKRRWGVDGFDVRVLGGINASLACWEMDFSSKWTCSDADGEACRLIAHRWAQNEDNPTRGPRQHEKPRSLGVLAPVSSRMTNPKCLHQVIRCGIARRAILDDLPAWSAVDHQVLRRMAAGCSGAVGQDLRAVQRVASSYGGEPAATIIGSWTPRGTSESGRRVRYDDTKRERGSTMSMIEPRSGVPRMPPRRPPGSPSRSPISIRATRVTRCPETAHKHGIALEVVKSSEASEASSCRSGAGRANAPSPGLRRIRRHLDGASNY